MPNQRIARPRPCPPPLLWSACCSLNGERYPGLPVKHSCTRATLLRLYARACDPLRGASPSEIPFPFFFWGGRPKLFLEPLFADLIKSTFFAQLSTYTRSRQRANLGARNLVGNHHQSTIQRGDVPRAAVRSQLQGEPVIR